MVWVAVGNQPLAVPAMDGGCRGERAVTVVVAAHPAAAGRYQAPVSPAPGAGWGAQLARFW
jgi:hypothetical protein